MRHPRITAAAVAVAAAAAIGGVTVASAASSSTPGYSTGTKASAGSTGVGSTPAGAATVQIATVSVHGTPESILEDAKGLPLYTYQPDTATTSHVSGQLASLWPPLVSARPTAAGATGTLRSLMTSNGQQVSYNGHFLYTFVEDSPGHVTGQGVQSFFVATPDLPVAAGSAGAASPAPANTPPMTNNGYAGY